MSEALKADILAATTVLAHPATEESLGLAMLEAMTLGKPVVAAASAGARFILEDGKSGVVVPPGEPGALGDAIAGLLQDPEEMQRVGSVGRQRASEFSNSAMVARTLQIWRTLISAKAKGQATVTNQCSQKSSGACRGPR